MSFCTLFIKCKLTILSRTIEVGPSYLHLFERHLPRRLCKWEGLIKYLFLDVFNEIFLSTPTLVTLLTSLLVHSLSHWATTASGTFLDSQLNSCWRYTSRTLLISSYSTFDNDYRALGVFPPAYICVHGSCLTIRQATGAAPNCS